MPSLLMYLCAGLCVHAAIGSLLMIWFMRNETCRFLWIKMPFFELLRLWLAFAFGWSLVIFSTVTGRKQLL